MAGTTTKSHDNTGGPGGSNRDHLIQHQNQITDLETLRKATLSEALNSGGLAIHGSASAVVKTASDIYCILSAGGAAQAIKKMAAGDLAALSGTVTNAKFGIWFFSWDGTTQSGVLAGGAAASLAAVTIPQIADGSACFGCVIINPTGTGDFVGGTTALDDATVVPNAVYLNFYGGANLSPTNVASALTAAKIGNMAGTAITV